MKNDESQNAGMWSEAMRVCREYLPSQEAALRRELGQRSGQLDSGSGAATGSVLLEEARRWLEVGEVRAALEILLREQRAPKPVLMQAADVLLHRAEPELAAQLGPDLGARLVAAGEQALAAQVCISRLPWQSHQCHRLKIFFFFMIVVKNLLLCIYMRLYIISYIHVHT